MNKTSEIKLSYIPGLKNIVFEELKKYSHFNIVGEDKDSFYINYQDDFNPIKSLRSVSRAYLVRRDAKYNPLYISKHKSILGDLIETVISKNEKGAFGSFKISCAGEDSSEVEELNNYIEDTFKLKKGEEIDMKVHIAKIGDVWEVGLQVTPRPLSVRDYRVRNMRGAMDSTIAYAMNYLCESEKYNSYLNIFSGSGTLLIEAGQYYQNLDKIIGFDNNKEHLSLSIQNIKKASLIKKVQVKEADIFDNPNFGKFDIIVSDLPFGMAISKNEDLEKLYKIFLEYSKNHLNQKGKLAVYTSEFKIFEKLILGSGFEISKSLSIQLITSEDEYLPTKIILLNLQ